jgi:hypothetical protein
VSPEISARLARKNIQVLAEGSKHLLLGRDLCVALVERTPAGFGSIGSTGVMTEAGLAYLVWRDGRAALAGKGGERAAQAGELESVQRFSEDLKAALGV